MNVCKPVLLRPQNESVNLKISIIMLLEVLNVVVAKNMFMQTIDSDFIIISNDLSTLEFSSPLYRIQYHQGRIST